MARTVPMSPRLYQEQNALVWETAQPEDAGYIRRFGYSKENERLFVELPNGSIGAFDGVSFVDWIKFQASPRRSPIMDAVAKRFPEMHGAMAEAKANSGAYIAAAEANPEAFKPKDHGVDGIRALTPSDRLLQEALYDVEWHDVDSSNVKRIAYNPDNRQLYVEFHTGQIYFYPDTYPGEWELFLQAPSKGKFVFDYLRGARGRRSPDLTLGMLDQDPYGRL